MKKIIDREGRLFGKISVIDVVVLLVVVILAGALYVKTNHRSITSMSAQDTPITYTFKVVGARNYVANAIQEGDVVYDQDTENTGGSLGTIVKIERVPAERLVEFQDGVILDNVPIEDSSNLILTIEGSGLVEGNKFLLNRIYPLGINANRNFCTTYAQFTGIVTDVYTS